ncbi:Malonyl CoA-acyl carrier protein transacylase [hydrothermal vent metagenome]|uniref:[acyl-carrier-protein] S-malonyltransferase n=1 Tax=hydrothermal vent metagenome TaxID=652676 RepID=A0A3B0TAS7_9ZZZZ
MSKKKIALIFPGQGAQTVGMGKEFYDSFSEAKETFDSADNIIPGLSDVIFNGSQEKLTSTAFCQPSIFTFSIAVLRVLEKNEVYQNLSPQFTCGLSLGECTSLCSSGVLSFEDSLKLVEKRSGFMEQATQQSKGAMAAVIGFDQDDLIKICDRTGAEVANFNSPDQIVITGEESKVKQASIEIKEAGAKRVIPLEVSGAFHSSLMQPAVDPFKQELASFNFRDAKFSILSNVDAQPTQDPQIIKKNLSKQITSSVQWVKSIEQIASQGVTDFLEIGPGTVLKGLIRKINRDLTVYNIQKPADIESLSRLN